MKFFTVICEVHGKYDVHPHDNDTCPKVCIIKDEDGKVCNLPLKRKYNAVPVHFKGKGFYSTDNAK